LIAPWLGGERGFPFHNHRLNAEMFYVPGGPELTHQIVNTGTGS
jgi:hypothetical protein